MGFVIPLAIFVVHPLHQGIYETDAKGLQTTPRFVIYEARRGFVTPSLTFCAKSRHPTRHKTLLTGLQIPSCFVAITQEP